jgi:hypothetical protein
MSETAATLVALRRICDELETMTNALRSLLQLMEAHKVVADSERNPPIESE